MALLLLTGGTFEWSGDYSDSSQLWTSSLRTEVDTRALQQTASGGGSLVKTSSTVTADDGSFWMKWGETTLCKKETFVPAFARSLTPNASLILQRISFGTLRMRARATPGSSARPTTAPLANG